MTDTIKRTFALPMGYRAAFSFTPATQALAIEWQPAVPSIQSPRHRRKFFEAYRAARRDFFEDVATVVGGAVGIADLNGDFEAVRPATKH